MRLNIYSPSRTLLQNEEVGEVSLTSSEGEVQVLPGHAAMAGTLETGRFSYKGKDGTEKDSGFISTGFFRIDQDQVDLMAEVLERKSEIDMSRAQKAQSKAQEELRAPGIDERRFRKYQLKLERALIRQQIAHK